IHLRRGDPGLAERAVRRPRRPPRGAPADRRYGRCRIVRTIVCRRGPPLPLLHAQSGRAQLRDLPPARSPPQMTAAQALRAEAAKRILIKDGAYGTLIQAERLKSEDY